MSQYHRIIKACATCGCGQVPGGMSGPAAAANPVLPQFELCDICGEAGTAFADGRNLCSQCEEDELNAGS